MRGLVHDMDVEIVDIKKIGNAISVVFRESNGQPRHMLVIKDQEEKLSEVESGGKGRPYDADGYAFRLASEGYRIRLAHLFDPLLAVHSSLVEPLPHQITAVYEDMLPRQPLKFLLADDPGAGKTIMAGLLIKELIARGDLKRCLICCPGSLVEQWQEEMRSKFSIAFQPLSRELVESDVGGNPFQTHNLVIGRVDQMSRSDILLARLDQAEDWDLVVVDEAHKMSCPWYGGEAKPTRRFDLGMRLAKKTRHILLMTATPHDGKDEDFQSFLRILDSERFEGRPRNGEKVEAHDIMRRMVKEELKRFDGTPLFPERRAETPYYELTNDEMELYDDVTSYVSKEMGRVERLIRAGEGKRGAIVGFAMTSLQRRLASSPEAIFQSLKRRRVNLETELSEIRKGGRRIDQLPVGSNEFPITGEVDEEDYPEDDYEEIETEVTTHVTSAQTIQELESEIAALTKLEQKAHAIRASSDHGKWNKLAEVLQNQPELFEADGHRRKLIIFTEHRDTLNYLSTRIRSLLGDPQSVVEIHGGMRRDERKYNQERFIQDREVLVLVATDAAGEGVNLQRASLLINYDIPWNPNRLEQRFGRIHRIGQTEVCYMWNLVAKDTREGQVWKRLFEKLDNERQALGNRVFDVLGRAIEAKELKDLMVEAIRYGNQPEVRERLLKKVDMKLDTKHLSELLEEKALATDSMDWTKIVHIKEEMERAEARKLQPHFIQAFFIKAFREIGGSIYERESKRFEIVHVPSIIKQRWEAIGKGSKPLSSFERITFEKELIQVPGKPTAEFVCPGHPLLDSCLDLILEKNSGLLTRGSVLVDESDSGTDPRMLWYIQSDIVDDVRDAKGIDRLVARQMHFVEMSVNGNYMNAGPAPYLNYRPLTSSEAVIIRDIVAKFSSLKAEDLALDYAVTNLLVPYFSDVRKARETIIDRTKAAVKERLTKEIAYWDARASELKDEELRGKNPRLNSGKARKKADDLQIRLNSRMIDLERERQVNMKPPFIVGSAIIIPVGLLPQQTESMDFGAADLAMRDEIEELAMTQVIKHETLLGRRPIDIHLEKRGYDIESFSPEENCLKFIEVKGRAKGAETLTISKNEILTGLNASDNFILAIVCVDENRQCDTRYVRNPFLKEPDFDVTSVNYNLKKLLERSEEPS